MNLIFLSEILGMVMRHDPLIMARVASHMNGDRYI